MKLDIPEGKILVQFDGMCILCSHTIQFILKADKEKKILFQTLQSTSGNKSFETVIVTDQYGSYQYFNAIFRIAEELNGIYKVVLILKLIPPGWRQSIYLWIAKNRFRWFGSRISCYIPTEVERERFI